MDKVDNALDAIEKYIEDGSPLPSTKSPYWEASESVPIVRSELARLRAERDELRAALKNLVFTASKLWDDTKPIKDSEFVRVTHPIIEEASTALGREA